MNPMIIRVSEAEMLELISSKLPSTVTDDGKEILTRSVKNSSSLWAGFDANGFLACFHGLIPPTLLSIEAYLWMYHTEALEGVTRRFIRRSREIVQDMLVEYPTIYGHGKIGDDRSLAWLRWLGVQFLEPQPPLIPFVIKAA